MQKNRVKLEEERFFHFKLKLLSLSATQKPTK